MAAETSAFNIQNWPLTNAQHKKENYLKGDVTVGDAYTHIKFNVSSFSCFGDIKAVPTKSRSCESAPNTI